MPNRRTQTRRSQQFRRESFPTPKDLDAARKLAAKVSPKLLACMEAKTVSA